MRKVEEYKEKRCNNHGFVKKNNISRAEADGLKEIKKKIKNKEMVVFCTDKSNKLAADSIRNYETALNEHTKDDTKGKKRNSWSTRRGYVAPSFGQPLLVVTVQIACTVQMVEAKGVTAGNPMSSISWIVYCAQTQIQMDASI